MPNFVEVKVVLVDDAFVEEFRKGKPHTAAALQAPTRDRRQAAK